MKILFLILIIFSCGLFVTGCKNLKHFQKEKFDDIVKYETYDSGNFVKGVPDSLLSIFNLVCSKYPELSKTDINLKFKSIKTTMQARPAFSFFRRKYNIYINNNPNFEGIKYSTMPLNAKVGLLAHEFSHIIDYESKNNFKIILTGLSYLSKKSKIDYEKKMDYLTIQKGFGYFLNDWAQFSMYDSGATDKYKEFKKEVYLEPHEIELIMNHQYSTNIFNK